MIQVVAEAFFCSGQQEDCEIDVKKACEYRQHADECRKMAQWMSGEQRDQLLNMAKVWEQLADDRERRLVKRLDDLQADAETDATS